MDWIDWLILIYLIGINLALFLAMGWDKRAARAGKERTPEVKLLSMGMLGGSVGGILGMIVFHHKVRKKAFSVGYPLMLVLHLAIGLFLLWVKGTVVL